MQIINEKLLKSFRLDRCEWCKWPRPTQAHHIYTRGSGRLDIRPNLIGLCVLCHGEAHGGQLMKCDLLLMVAARERCLQDDITQLVYLLRRLDKDTSPADVAAAVGGLGIGARTLGRRVLVEAGLKGMEAAGVK